MMNHKKEYIEKLLVKYMDGTSTLSEEADLASYFRNNDVPEEWKDYQLLFEEIEAMRPIGHRNHHRLWWSIAVAAVIVGILFVAIPKRQTNSMTALADTITTRQEVLPVIEQTAPVIERKFDIPSDKKNEEQPVQIKKRSLRKKIPSIHDDAKAYALMAATLKEQQEAEQKVVESRIASIQAQLEALGYQSVKHEDGTIEYIDKNIIYTAYEE